MTGVMRSRDFGKRLTVCSAAGCCIVLFGIMAFPIPALAQDDEKEQPQSMHLLADPAPAEAPDQAPVPPNEAEKRKKATAATAAIGGIAILGIGVIAWTMLWARRLRRFARDPGPAQTTLGNDFWFLKPPKTIPSDSDVTTSAAPPKAENSE